MTRLLPAVVGCLLVFSAAAQRGTFNDGGAATFKNYSFNRAQGYLRYQCPVGNGINALRLTVSRDSALQEQPVAVTNGSVNVDVLFSAAGPHRYALYDAANALVDSGTIDITVNDEQPIAHAFNDEAAYDEYYDYDSPNSPYNTDYYIGTRAVVSATLDADNKPTADTADISIPAQSVGYIYVEHTRPLATEYLFVDVYSIKNNKQVFIETQELPAGTDANFTTVPYTFRKPGTYVFKIFNDNDVWIANALVTVKFR